MRGRGRDEPTGVLFLDKPQGPSSHELVASIRWALGTTRVGHCGTLDPGATGVLVVCVGQCTRIAERLSATDKRYEAVIALGRSTSTADAMGETVESAELDGQAAARFASVLGELRGALSLSPPAYSAIHVDGVRAHELARGGAAISLPPREMFVAEIATEALDVARVGSAMLVRKGTYVRSLVTEASARSGVPAHLSALRRTAAGHVRIEDCLGPFSAQAWSDDHLGAPRFRIRAPGCADRASLRDFLLAGLRSPEDALGIATCRPRDDTQRSVVDRLAQGQRLGLLDPRASWLWRLALGGESFPPRPGDTDQIAELERLAVKHVGALVCLRDPAPSSDGATFDASGVALQSREGADGGALGTAAPGSTGYGAESRRQGASHERIVLVEVELGERGPRLAPRLVSFVPTLSSVAGP